MGTPQRGLGWGRWSLQMEKLQREAELDLEKKLFNQNDSVSCMSVVSLFAGKHLCPCRAHHTNLGLIEAGALGSTTAFTHLNFNSALNLVLLVPCITWGESTIFLNCSYFFTSYTYKSLQAFLYFLYLRQYFPAPSDKIDFYHPHVHAGIHRSTWNQDGCAATLETLEQDTAIEEEGTRRILPE